MEPQFHRFFRARPDTFGRCQQQIVIGCALQIERKGTVTVSICFG